LPVIPPSPCSGCGDRAPSPFSLGVSAAPVQFLALLLPVDPLLYRRVMRVMRLSMTGLICSSRPLLFMDCALPSHTFFSVAPCLLLRVFLDTVPHLALCRPTVCATGNPVQPGHLLFFLSSVFSTLNFHCKPLVCTCCGRLFSVFPGPGAPTRTPLAFPRLCTCLHAGDLLCCQSLRMTSLL